MKKSLVVALLALCVLFAFSSCKKSEGGDSSFLSSVTGIFQSDSKAESSAQSKTAATDSSKRSAPDPSKMPSFGQGERPSFDGVAPTDGKRPEGFPEAPNGFSPEVPAGVKEEPSKATAALVEAQPESSVEEADPVLFSNVYRGGTCFIVGEFTAEKATITCRNMSQDDMLEMIAGLVAAYPGTVNIFQYNLADNQILLSYDKMSEGEIRAYWDILKNYVSSTYSNEKDAKNKTVVSLETTYGAVKAEIYPMEAKITVPSTITETEVFSFLSSLATENPEVLDFCTCTYDDGVIDIAFLDAVDEELALSYWGKIAEALSPYIVPVVTEAKVSDKVEEKPAVASEGAKATPTTRIAETSAKDEKAIVPAIKKGSLIKEKSFSVTASADTAMKNGPSFGLGGRVEARFTDNFSAGVKIGYQSKAYIPLVAYAKVEILNNVYTFGGVGFRLSLDGQSKGGLVLEVGAGYEYEITDELRVFAEGSVIFENNNPGVRLTVGGRYSF